VNYPFWDVDIGYGILMAAIAVIHVFVSHFAIGGGLYLVVAEHIARKAGDAYRLEFLERLSKFFVLTTVVFGALTGVGIWFVIGLLNPAATEVLIHNFVWGWATEWTFFAIEILAALLYYYGWKKLPARSHLIIGWIYFGAAWMSLFVINGIITFMLTPGDWLTTGNFWDGFFNPTFWSSLVLRTGICILLAGLFSLVVAGRQKPEEKKGSLVRFNTCWGLLGLIIAVPSFWWYFRAIPEDIRATAAEMMPFVMQRVDETYWFAAGIAVLLIIFGLLIPRRFNVVIGIVGLALGLVFFGEYEWLREAIRKPYVVYGYMYGNAVEVAHQDDYLETGYLEHMAFKTGDDGADLFRRACRSCHTIDGYKALKPFFDGTDEEFIAGIVRGTGAMKGNMPPWYGTEEESQLLAAHLYKQVDQRHMSEVYGLSGVELGRKIYELRCSGCHEIGGYNDKFASLVDLTEEDYNDILDMAGDFAEEMPDFTGDEVERAALIQYLMTLTEGGQDATAGL
jgi:mono/diheme cytochrome c family protein